MAQLKKAWEELLGFLGQDETERSLRDNRVEARVIKLVAIFAEKELVIESSRAPVMCDASDRLSSFHIWSCRRIDRCILDTSDDHYVISVAQLMS